MTPSTTATIGFERLTANGGTTLTTSASTPRELRDAGDAVVSLHELTGRTKGSGIPMTMQIGAVVSKFADGRIGVQRLFPSWESALQAADVSE